MESYISLSELQFFLTDTQFFNRGIQADQGNSENLPSLPVALGLGSDGNASFSDF